jgi:hypothetical protein
MKTVLVITPGDICAAVFLGLFVAVVLFFKAWDAIDRWQSKRRRRKP